MSWVPPILPDVVKMTRAERTHSHPCDLVHRYWRDSFARGEMTFSSCFDRGLESERTQVQWHLVPFGFKLLTAWSAELWRGGETWESISAWLRWEVKRLLAVIK